MQPLLELAGLDVRFTTREGEVSAVLAVSLEVRPGECLGVMGESGSGKSQTFLAALGLLARNGRASGVARFGGEDLLASPDAMHRARGARIGMIFQDPMTALTPHLTIGEQLCEVLEIHRSVERRDTRAQALTMLQRVHMSDAAARLDQYPHELSGGMRQRVMIAMTLLAGPQLVVADEPTTALDVTVQAGILALFRELRRVGQLSLVVISHDAGVIAELADRVVVMYAGRIVEEASAQSIFQSPRHPYTQGLLAAVPRIDDRLAGPLATISGQPPARIDSLPGCSFADRCPRVSDRCRAERPRLRSDGATGGQFACHHPVPVTAP
ncbi:MAG: ABC transporter ATP-binding protein [Steroidobacterales bacterium]